MFHQTHTSFGHYFGIILLCNTDNNTWKGLALCGLQIIFSFNFDAQLHINRSCLKHTFTWSVSISCRWLPKHFMPSAHGNSWMSSDTFHNKRRHSIVDRLLPNIDKAKQKHEAFHAKLEELLKIEGVVSIWRKDILVPTPLGNVRSKHWQHKH